MNHLSFIMLLSFILWGCSSREQKHLAKPNKRSAVVATQNQTPIIAVTKTPDLDGDNHLVHRVRDGGAFCENYLLKKIAKEKADGSRIVKLKAFNPNEEALSPELKTWLERMDETKTAAYELKNDNKKVLLISSYSRKATGLSTSFQSWFIQLDNHSNEFFSFSSEPKLIFFDKDGLLNYYSVDYSDELIENRDWNNPIFDLARYRITPDGKSQLVSKEQNVKCE